MEVIDMLTKGAIGNLINRYRAVLKKCHLMNTFGSLAVASMLVMGAAGAAEAATYFEKAPDTFTTVIDQPNNQNNYSDVTEGTTVLVSGANTTSGAQTSMAVTGQSGTTLYNKGSIWVKDGYAEAMNGTYNADFTIKNQGKIFVSGNDALTALERTKGMSVNPNGKAYNEGLIAVLKGSGMTDNSGSNAKTLVNNGIISAEETGGVGIYYRKENATNGEVTNNGSIFASNGGMGVLITNDKNDASYNNKYFTNTGTISADDASTAILVAGTDNATINLKGDKSHIDGLISLQGTDNNLVIDGMGSQGQESLYVKGAFSGEISNNSNVAFTDNSDITLDDRFIIDNTSTADMSSVKLAQGESAADKGLVVIDTNGTTINGGMATGTDAAASIGSLVSDKGNVVLDNANMSGNALSADRNYPVIGAVSATLADGQSLSVSNSLFNGNSVTLTGTGSSGQSGGAAISVTGKGNLSVTGTDFIGNSYKDAPNAVNGAYGGAVGVQSSAVTLNDVTFDGNKAESSAQVEGAAYYQSIGSLNAKDITVSGNKAYSDAVLGTGMALFGTSGSLSGATFSGNVSESDAEGSYAYGGGLYLRGSRWGGEGDLKFSIADSSFTGNSMSAGEVYGAGLNIKGDDGNTDPAKNGHLDLALSNVTFDGNTANGAKTYGGGMYVENAGTDAATVDMQNVTFKNNASNGTVEGFGGAVYNYEGSVTIADGTFENNTAATAGGALYNTTGGNVTLSGNNTFTDNTANGTPNDIHNAGALTVADGVTKLNSGYTQEGAASSLTVNTGATLAVAMPDMGGVTASSDEALLALGKQLNLGEGRLRMGSVSADNDASVAFGNNSLLVVDGKAANAGAMITGTGDISVDGGSRLYIANAQAGEAYTITSGLATAEGEYWKSANLLTGRLVEAAISTDGDKIVVETEGKNVVTVLPGIIPVAGINTMIADNLNDTDSASAGIRFLSRAMDNVRYMPSDSAATGMVNEVSRAAVTAGVQNTALRLADAAADQLAHHLSLSFFGKENNIHKDGVDIWATPMYGNTYTHGMVASGAAVRGNYGGVTLGADAKVGEILGGKVRVGAAVNGGGGKSETRGTVTSTDNEYNFGGVNLYAGWNLDNLNVMASVGYAMGNHDVKMNLPAAMNMGQAKADVDTNAFIADLRAEYQINTPVVDILPHAGVRYTALNTESHDLKVNGSTLNSVASDTQHIVQFPIGVTVSKDIDVAGWNVKPQADVSVIPAAGEKKNTTKVSYAGIGALDSVNTRIMDSTSWAGMVGVQAEKGNFALGLNYGVQASSHETDQSVSVGISWKF